MASATIDLGLNASPFEQGLARAQTATATFSSRVEGLFKRDIAKRAEIGLSEFAANLATGNVAGAVTGLASRISGPGLAAGVGIGVAAAVFSRFKAQLEDTAKAREKLEEQLARPFELRAALSPGGQAQEIATTQALLADLEKKRQTFASRIEEAATAGQPDVVDTSSRAAFEASMKAHPDRVSQNAKDQKAAKEDLLKSEMALGDAELARARVKAQSLLGSKEEAELLKVQLDYEERIAVIKLKGGSTESVAKRLQAADIEHRAIVDDIYNKQSKTAADKVFADRLSLESAKALTREMELQSGGQDFQADVFKIRSTASQEIAQQLHEGRPELAEQTEAQENLSVGERQFQEYQRVKHNPRAYRLQQKRTEREHEQFERQSGEFFDQRNRGVYGQHGPMADIFLGGQPDIHGVPESREETVLPETKEMATDIKKLVTIFQKAWGTD